MRFFTCKNGRRLALILLLWINGIFTAHPLHAQAVTNMDAIPDPTALETPGATARMSNTNAPSASVPVPNLPETAPTLPALVPSGPAPSLSAPLSLNTISPESSLPEGPVRSGAGEAILAALLSAAALGGFVLYYCGLTRA